MGKLSIQELPTKLKTPSLTKELKEIKRHDDQCSFHVEPTSSIGTIPYKDTYLDWVKKILDSSKHDVFKHLLTAPIETVDFTEGLTNELKKAFNAQDKNISFQTINKEVTADYEAYLKGIKDAQFWMTEGFSAMKSNINAVLIVDLPALPVVDGEIQQTTRYPSPYYYLLAPCDIIDADVNRDGSIEWIIFKNEYIEDAYFLFDEDFFTSFIYKDGKVQSFTQTPHDLGYCPAHTFWSTPFNKESKLQRRGPLTNALAKLDDLLFNCTSTKHGVLYAGFPMIVMYERRCTYQDAQGNACNSGKLTQMVRTDPNSEVYAPKQIDCPNCSNRAILGAGTIITAPAPSEKGDADLIDGVKTVPAEVDSLEFLKKMIIEQKQELTANIVGIAKEVSEAAKNEMQVGSGFESRLNVILWVKENMEIIHKFALETMGKLRYGKSYMGCNVSYGTKFYLYEFMDLLNEYKESKANGLPNFELDSQIDQMMNTKYQSNPDSLQRSKILKALEPYTTYSLLEIKNLPGPIDNKKIILKRDFPDYIARFEREFMDVVGFMPYAEMQDKIEFIKAKLMEYVEEDATTLEAEQPEPEPAAGGAPFGK